MFMMSQLLAPFVSTGNVPVGTEGREFFDDLVCVRKSMCLPKLRNERDNLSAFAGFVSLPTEYQNAYGLLMSQSHMNSL